MPDKITYSITTKSGKTHQIAERDIKKYGMAAYAKNNEGATLHMQDASGADYDIPLTEYEGALGAGLRVFNAVDDANTPTLTAAGNKGLDDAQRQQGQAESVPVVDEDTNKQQGAKQAQPKATPMTAQERAQMMQRVGGLVNTAVADTQQARQQVANKAVYAQKAGLNYGQTVAGGMKFNPETKKLEQTYLTPQGLETTNKAVADMDSFAYRVPEGDADLKRVNRVQVDDMMEDVDQQLEVAYKDAQDRYKEAKPTVWQNIVRGLADRNAGTPLQTENTYETLVSNDVNVRALHAAKNSLTNAKSLIAEADKAVQEGTWDGFFKGALRGLGNKLFDARTWDMGLRDAQDGGALLAALKAFDKKERLTPAQQALLDAKAVELATNAYFGSYIGRGYKAGEVTAESIPFMIEMCLNPASGAGHAAQSMLTRYALKRFGKEMLKGNAKKWLAAKVGARMAGDLVGSAGMTATTGMTRTVADAGQRMAGDLKFDINHRGESVFDGHEKGDSAGAALAKAFVATTIENYSEMVGEYFAPVLSPATKWVGGKLAKGMEKIGLGKVNDFIRDVKASDVAKLVTDFEKNAKWNGVFNEYAEEVAGNLMNAATVKDMTFDTAEGTGVFNLDQNIDTFLGVSLMGGFMSGAKTIGYRTPKYRQKKNMTEADRIAGRVFGNQEVWGDIRNTLAFGNDQEVHDKLASVLKAAEYTEQQKRAAMQYAKEAEKYRGMLQAEQKRRTDGDADALQTDLETSYDNGRTLATAEEMNDAKNMLDFKARVMRERLGLKEGEEDMLLGDDPTAYINGMRQTHSNEQLSAVIDYANAKATFDGMTEAAGDAISEKVADEKAKIDSRTNRDTGELVPATMKVDDREVFVVGGNVVMFDDGSAVDQAKSSESIIVMDAKTGRMEFTSPDRVLYVGEKAQAEEEKIRVADETEQRMTAETTAKISGVVPFKAGDTYTLLDKDGGEVGVTVLFDDGAQEANGVEQDVMLVQTANGNVVPMKKADIQSGVDAYNLKRLELNEQQKNEIAGENTEPGTGNINNNAAGEVKPVGHGVFGNIYDQFKGKAKAAIAFLMNLKSGEAIGALHHKDIGDISIAWGNDKAGLQKIAQKHPEVLDNLQEIIDGMNIVQTSDNRIKLESDTHFAVVSRDWNGEEHTPWLLTAYEKKESSATNNSMDTAGTLEGKRNDTATPQNTAYADKITETADTKQEIGVKDVENEGNRAIDRIPKDEKGMPLLEQTDPETAWDGVVEFMENEDDARDYVQSQVKLLAKEAKNAAAAVGRVKTSADMAQFKADKAAARQKQAEAEDRLAKWQAIADVNAVRKKAEQTRLAVERAEADRIAHDKAVAVLADRKRRAADAAGEAGTTEESRGERENTIPAGSEGGVRQVRNVGKKFSEAEAADILSRMEERAEQGEFIELTPDTWNEQFGEDGIVSTPIGDVKMGENQVAKLFLKKRTKEFGYIKHTLTNPDIVIEKAAPADGAERESKYLFVKAFIKPDGSRLVNYESVTVLKGGMEVSISSHEVDGSVLKKEMQNGIVLHLNDKLSISSEEYLTETQTERPDLVPTPDNDISKERPLLWTRGADTASEEGATTPFSTIVSQQDDKNASSTEGHNEVSFANKSTETLDAKQANGVKLSELGETSSQEEVEAQRAAMNTAPTEAQKLAGNYKKGRIKVDGYDIALENPKGSVRSGKDADGKEWRIRMKHDYGYIRGIEGVDGDEIDVYLSDTPTEGNVYVVDQVNQKTGAFDEHKVMYGFGSMQEAVQAYRDQYEDGWKVGKVTEVSREEFKKWVESSARKTKPFADYASVKPLSAQSGEELAETRNEERDGKNGAEEGVRFSTKDNRTMAEIEAEEREIAEANERFNEELDVYERGELRQNHRFDLGMPSVYLRSAGFPNLPISMRSSLLKAKAALNRHPFDAKDLKDLVQAIQRPIAVLKYSKDNMRNVIVDIMRGDKHFLVGVTLNYKGGDIEINSVSGLFPKDSHEWLKWIQEGRAIRIDQKEKVQSLIDSQRTTNTVESERIGLNLDSVAKIVKTFENPAIESRNSSVQANNSGYDVEFRTKKPNKNVTSWPMGKEETNRVIDEATAFMTGRSVGEVRKMRVDQEQERRDAARDLYRNVLAGDFNDVTLHQINDYIDEFTPKNPYGRHISERLPQKVERELHGRNRANAVDALFSRIAESAVETSGRSVAERGREITKKKNELLEGWARATGNWHTEVSDFTDDAEPIGRGKDSDVYYSKDGDHVVKVSKGKDEGRKFISDIDAVALYNGVFPNTAYNILGFGEVDGKPVKFLEQPRVHFAENPYVSEDERVDFMRSIGFEPLKKSNTIFSNGVLVVSDVQKGNIVKGANGEIYVIDADVKLHTKDLGGEYSYPDAGKDTEDRRTRETDDAIQFSVRTKPAPEKTVKSYKLFRVDENGNPYALFIDAESKLPVGTWLDADSPNMADLEKLEEGDYFIDNEGNAAPVEKKPGKRLIQEAAKAGNGRYMKVGHYADGTKSFANYGINGSGSVGTFALRPGWHSTNAPSARHIGAVGEDGKTKAYRRPNERWFEIEVSADRDYNEEAAASTSKAKGIDTHIPEDGWYEFQTNSNANPNQTWIIAGAIRVVRPLSEEEAHGISRSMGVEEDLPYKDGVKSFEEDVRFRVAGEKEDNRNVPAIEQSQREAAELAIGLIRQSGIEVSMDEKEMQQVLAANERLQEMKKPAQETASSPKAESHQTVVSSADGAKVLNKIRTSKSAEIKGDEIAPSDDLKQYKKNALEYGKTLRGEYTNADTGRTVVVGKNGIKEVLQHDYKDVEQLQSIAAIPQIIEKGIYIGSEPNNDIDKNPNISEYQYYVCGMRIGGVDYTVRSVYGIDSKGNRYYDHKLTHIEKGKLLDSLIGITNPGFSQATDDIGFGTTPGTKPTTDISVSKDKKLISLLKGLKKETENPLQKMTVYHGSGADFDAFDHSHMGEGEGAQAYGWGTYVTEVNGIARKYAEAMSSKGRNNNLQIRVKENGVWATYPYEYVNGENNANRYMSMAYDLVQDARTIADARARADKFIDIAEDEQMKNAWREVLDILKRHKKADFKAETPRILYTVDIPENTGKNYLKWDEPVSEAQKQRVIDVLVAMNTAENEAISRALDKAELNVRTMGENNTLDNGRALQYALKHSFGDQAASAILSQAGFAGIEYPAEYRSGGRTDGAKNYVIFNEADAKITSKTQFLRTRKGEVYGFVKDGKIYLDPTLLNPNTPIHEYTHIWDRALQKANPELWRRGVELMRQTPLWDEVVGNPAYADIAGNENLVASEVHSRLTGKQGQALFTQMAREARQEGKGVMQQAHRLATLEKLRQWISEAWQWLKDTMTPWTKEEAQGVSLDDFVNMPLKDLVEGKKLKDEAMQLITDEELAKRMDAIDRIVPTDISAIQSMNKAQAEDAMMGLAQGENKYDGRKVAWVKNTVGKILRHKGFDSSTIIPALKDIYDNSIPILSEREIKKDGHKEHTNFVGYHHYLGRIVKEGKVYNVRLTLQEVKTKKKDFVPNQLHSTFISDVEITNADSHVNTGISPATATTSTVIDAKLRKFFEDAIKAKENIANKKEGKQLKAESASNRNEVETVNVRFNTELKQQINDALPNGHIYNLGTPGMVLQRAGIPALPMQMNAARLKEKATKFGHDFDLKDVMDLPMALEKPIAVFSYGNGDKAKNIIVELTRNGKHFNVGLFIRPVVNGVQLEINSIRNVFPKDNAEWLNWISEGKANYLDKEKIQALIDKQRTILADVEYLDLDLVAKLTKDFDNANVGAENNAGEPIRYRFIGENGAVNADHAEEVNTRMDNLAVARDMEKDGKDAKAIKRATGWERGADGKWRYEVADFKLAVNGDGRLDEVMDKEPWGREYKELENKLFKGDELTPEQTLRFDELQEKVEQVRKGLTDPLSIKTLEDYVRDETLFKEYPQLRNMPVRFGKLEDEALGVYNPIDNSIAIDNKVIRNARKRMADLEMRLYKAKYPSDNQRKTAAAFGLGGQEYWDGLVKELEGKLQAEKMDFGLVEVAFKNDVKSVLAHELQHAIQEIEGFARGSSLKTANNNKAKYRATAGEVEARNVQSRMGMTAEQRRESLAAETQDVDTEDQLFLYDGLERNDMHSRIDKRMAEADGNERFNEELQRYIDGSMSANEMLHVGMPRDVMTYFLPDLPIIMRQKAMRKGTEKKHNVSLEALRNLPDMISNPIMVFARNENTIGILTEMKDRDGKNVCVAIEIAKTRQDGGEYLEVNDIRSFHGREVENIVSPIVNNGTLRWSDKEKALAWLSSASQQVQQETVKQELSSAAKVVKEFDNAKAESGEFKHSAENNAESAKRTKVDSLSATLHKPIRVAHSTEFKGRKARAKGWYDTETGEIVVVLDNNKSVADVEMTVLHEAVAHYGLRQLFGERFDALLDNVYGHATEGVRKKIDALAAKNGVDVRTATEEYLAGMAENMDFEDMEQKSWWAKVKRLFADMLNTLGFEYMGPELTDNELRYILWRSYENLKVNGRRGIIEHAKDVAMQSKLGVGEFDNEERSVKSEEPAVAAEEDIEAVNDEFNSKLDEFDEEKADSTVFNLGRPSAVLLAAGVKDMPMKLYGSKVLKKMKKHGFAAAELRDLPRAVANPIAVFDNYKTENNRSVLTELHTKQGNFLVSLKLGKDRDVDFNIITSVFGKGGNNIVDWLKKGYATYINKEKAHAFLFDQSAPIAAAAANAELNSAAKIVKGFNNTSVGAEKNAGVKEKTTIDYNSPNMKSGISALQRIAEGAEEIKGAMHRDDLIKYGGTADITLVFGTPGNAEKGFKGGFGIAHIAAKHGPDSLFNVLAAVADGKVSRFVAGNKTVVLEKDGYEAVLALTRNGNKDTWLLSGWDKIENTDDNGKVSARHVSTQANPTFSRTDLGAVLSSAKIVKGFNNPTIHAEENEGLEEDLTDDGVLFRDGDPEVHERKMARDLYEKRIKSGVYQMQEALQDSMLALRKAMEAIMGNRKMRIEQVPDFENAYLGENRLSSVNQAEIEAWHALLFKPLLEVVAKLAPTEQRRTELTDYMMAKHGLERNRLMAEREAKKAFDKYIKEHPKTAKTLQDFVDEHRQRDYAGLTALTGLDNVVDAEAEAMDMVQRYEAANDTTMLWDRLNEVNRATLTKQYDAGMIDQKTRDEIAQMYNYYIPLRGFDEETSAEAYAYLGHSGSALNAPIKTAKGRTSKADDPIANMANMAESSIIQGNRNLLVKQRFLNFVLNNPSDLVSVNELWLAYDDVADEWKPVLPDNINDTDTPEEVERKMLDFESRMEALLLQHPDRYMRSSDAVGIPYKVADKRDVKNHQVLVKRGGKTFVLTVNGNPRLAQAVNGETNPDNDAAGALGKILRLGEGVNRQLSAFYTTRNPDFVLSNFIRDMLYSNCVVWVKEKPAYALRFNENVVMLNPVNMGRLFSAYRNGKLDMGKPTHRLFAEFMRNGGETGYVSLRDIEAIKRDVINELKHAQRSGWNPKTWWKVFGIYFDELGRSVENAARFAAYMTSRQLGRSIARAVYDAKEISVNFNKKGAGAKFLDANGQTMLGNAAAFVSGLGRSGFVFWNAAIQGTTNFGRQLKRNTKKALAMSAAWFLLGALSAAMGAGDDDDDKDAYFNLPEHVRRSNLILRLFGTNVSLPLPTEFRAIYGMGELMQSVLSGKERLGAEELSMNIAGQLSQVMPVDMLEGGGGWQAFVPSAAKPVVEAYVTEKSWTGMPIDKSNVFNKNMPEWTKAYSSANRYLVNMAKALNEAGGGDDFTKGYGPMDLNPAKLEYVLNGYLGGVSGTIDKMTKMAETVAGQREYDPRSFLFVNRVVKGGDERTQYRAVNNAYFRLKEEMEVVNQRLKGYEGQADQGVVAYAKKLDYLYNSEDVELNELFKEYQKGIDVLNTELKMAHESQDKEAVKMIEAELYGLKKELLEAAESVRKAHK